MKLCKDCKWAVGPSLLLRVFTGREFAKCHHPRLRREVEVNPVTGKSENKGEWWYCSTNRMYSHSENYCGFAGNLWEPRK